VRKRLLSRTGPDLAAPVPTPGLATPIPGDSALARGAAAKQRRDRRGRGLRGPLAPAGVPIARTRSERFDDLVLDALDRLDPRWGRELADVELAVEEVPPADNPQAADSWPAARVPLARLFRAQGKAPGKPLARIVLYRRPIEARAPGRIELAVLVHNVVVEEVAELLGVDPETVDPSYDGWD
jgi:predicted Zn-dependent protease with MMP-like domain